MVLWKPEQGQIALFTIPSGSTKKNHTARVSAKCLGFSPSGKLIWVWGKVEDKKLPLLPRVPPPPPEGEPKPEKHSFEGDNKGDNKGDIAYCLWGDRNNKLCPLYSSFPYSSGKIRIWLMFPRPEFRIDPCPFPRLCASFLC